MSVATRVSQELGVNLGEEVGYSVKMHSKFSNATLIKYMTDGTLIKEMMQDPLLTKYSVLMIDDVHERSINTDIILGLLKKIQRKRKDLKLIISSATLDARPLAFFFQDPEHCLTSEVYAVPGRAFKVDIFYSKHPVKNFVSYSAKLSLDLHRNRPSSGDILVFMPGLEEIEVFMEVFQRISSSADLRNCEIH